MSDLEALLERVKAATGPDKQLDWEIWDAVGQPNLTGKHSPYLPFTASIDAAIALVEKILPPLTFRSHGFLPAWSESDGAPYRCHFNPENSASSVGYGNSDALAILAALLQALIARQSA